MITLTIKINCDERNFQLSLLPKDEELATATIHEKIIAQHIADFIDNMGKSVSKFNNGEGVILRTETTAQMESAKKIAGVPL